MNATADRIQAALDDLRQHDPHLYDLIDLMADLGATLDEIEQLALDEYLVIDDGSLYLESMDDDRWVELSVHAVDLLTHVALPTGQDAHDVQRRFTRAMNERGVDVTLDRAVRILAERRELDEGPGLP